MDAVFIGGPVILSWAVSQLGSLVDSFGNSTCGDLASNSGDFVMEISWEHRWI